MALTDFGHHRGEIGIVLDDQQARPAPTVPHHRQLLGFAGRCQLHRQFHREAGALARRALHADPAAQYIHQLPGNCQPQAGAAVLPADGSVDLLERQKNAFLLRLGNADTGIPHLDQQHIVVRLRRRPAAHAHLHLAPLGELQRVGQQVAQNLQQAHPVADQQRRYIRVHLHTEKQPFLFGHWRQAGLELVQQFAQIERLQLELHVSGLDPRQVQNVVDQLQQIVPGTVDDLGVAHLLVAEVATGILFQLVAENQDAVERRAQLVGHVGKEFRLVAIGDHQLVRLLAQALLGGLAMADIDDDRLHQQFVAAAQRRETDLDR